ncbi:hypothetical protein FTUN_6378 [Frigoriglobus tundricola]|uniref:Uncharacterized protein n=1 Tax=Frigoriglobus tundricola TaxID=2774151 RepID=A0A6M5YZX5_9BACT|nr:hypothetical protein FTUN_6378 [Frigoriglobus tundricola]
MGAARTWSSADVETGLPAPLPNRCRSLGTRPNPGDPVLGDLVFRDRPVRPTPPPRFGPLVVCRSEPRPATARGQRRRRRESMTATPTPTDGRGVLRFADRSRRTRSETPALTPHRHSLLTILINNLSIKK